MPEETPPTVFISYSRKDEREKEHLLSHLKVLQIGSNLIDVWSEDRVGVGLDWEDEIRQALNQAQIVILLISASYLGTEFIINDTIPALLQRRREEGLVVFPVIAKPSAWQKVNWLARMSVRPRSQRPVWGQGGSHADEDLALIAEEIATIASRARPPASTRPHTQPSRDISPSATTPASFNTAKIRRLLTNAFDDPTLDAFCQDYFYEVYSNFSRGLRKDEKISALLDRCRRSPRGFEQLREALQEQFQGDGARLSEIADLLPNQQGGAKSKPSPDQVSRANHDTHPQEGDAPKTSGSDAKRQPPSFPSPEPEAGLKDFFISYNSKDRQWAEWVAWQLEEAGYTSIIQAWDFRPGGNFVIDMQRAAAGVKRTIAVLSDNYLNALYTQPEWASAFSQDPTGEKKTLLPIRVQPCNLTGMWSSIVYIDLVGLSEAEARQRLLEGLQTGRAKPSTAPGFPGGSVASEKPPFPEGSG